VEQWIEVMEAQRELTAAQAAGRRDVEDEVLTRLDRLDDDVHFLNEQGDIDSFMLRAKAKLIAKQNGETLNILNQVIATYPQFLPALTEKALLLASAGEWEQALDMAQRCVHSSHRAHYPLLFSHLPSLSSGSSTRSVKTSTPCKS